MAARRLAAMAMDLAFDFHGNRQKTPISYPSLGYHLVGNLLNVVAAALENRDFQATVVVEMDVHGRQRHVMMLMKGVDEPLA